MEIIHRPPHHHHGHHFASWGLPLTQLAEDALRDQVAASEEIHVRIDNVPTYQILNGRVEHLRIAGRGIAPRQFPETPHRVHRSGNRCCRC